MKGMDHGVFMLIALAIGYLIVIKGDKEKGFLRALGLVTGFFIMVMSFFMIMLYSAMVNYPPQGKMMGMHRPMMKHMLHK